MSKPFTRPYARPTALLTTPEDERFHDHRRVSFGQKDGKHVLAIQTSNRPNGNSLIDTIESLRKAGLDRWRGPKLIVSDGYVPPSELADAWIIRSNPPPSRGTSSTFLRLLVEAIRICPDLKRLTSIQDDVTCSCNALDYIEHVEIDDDLALVSWYTSWKWRGLGQRTYPLLEIGKCRYFMRSQAITLPRRTIDLLLADPMIRRWPYRHNCDQMFSHTMSERLFASHYPVLFQHTEGTNSACGHDGKAERTSMDFAGETFDASTLMDGA